MPSRNHWELFVKMCNGIDGFLVSDAYVAALAIEHGRELITTDSDFARFRSSGNRFRLARRQFFASSEADEPRNR
jgi:predicted nucleic acid-binding protein